MHIDKAKTVDNNELVKVKKIEIKSSHLSECEFWEKEKGEVKWTEKWSEFEGTVSEN